MRDVNASSHIVGILPPIHNSCAHMASEVGRKHNTVLIDILTSSPTRNTSSPSKEAMQTTA